MTDLGNGLFAVSVPEDATEIQDTYAYGIMWKNSKGMYDSFYFEIEPPFKYEILGTVTKDNIDFDVAEYCDINRGNMANEIYFRSLLSSKGMHFENPCGEPNKSYFRSTYDCAFHRYNWQEPYEKAVEKWQQAQNNLIEKLVIIKKV